MKKSGITKRGVLATMAFSLGLVVSAQAAPINLEPGPVFIQYNNLEQVDQSGRNSIVVPGGYGTAGNWGILNVSTIQRGGVATPHQDISGGTPYFVDDGPDDLFGMGQVTGLFYGVNLTSGTTATGGTIDLYWHDAATDFVTEAHMNGTSASPDAATVAAFTGGTFLARLNFAAGIIPGDATTTLLSSTDITATTGSGRAELFADVDLNRVGAWTTVLDSDWFYVDTDGDGVAGENGERRDLRLATFYNFLAAWDDPTNPYVKGLRSNDPARGNVVPEPSTFILMGAGLLGVAGYVRRRNRK